MVFPHKRPVLWSCRVFLVDSQAVEQTIELPFLDDMACMWRNYSVVWLGMIQAYTVYPKIHAHGFVVLCFVVVMQSFIMNSYEVFIHIHQDCFAGTGAIVRLPQCQWSKPEGYGKISQCITTTKHSKAKTVRMFLGIYCISIVCQTWGRMVAWIVLCWFGRHLLTGRGIFYHMITSSNRNIFRVIGPLCGEFPGHRWNHRTKAIHTELWCFLLSKPE